MTFEIPTRVDARTHLPMPRDCTGCDKAIECVRSGNAAARALLEKVGLEPIRGGNIGIGVDYTVAESVGAENEYLAVVDTRIDLEEITRNCPGAVEEYGDTKKVICGME